jgi:hypothetical protein
VIGGGAMKYEHFLRLTVDPAAITGFDAAGSVVRARGLLKDRDIDVRRVETRAKSSAIDVLVHLPGAEAPDEQVTGLILRALGLPATPRGPAISLLPAVPAGGTVFRGGGTRSFDVHEGSFPGNSYGGDTAAGPDKRYLHGEYPETVRPDTTFSLLVRIVTDDRGGGALKRFDVPAQGRDVLLILHAPGLEALGPQRQPLHVPQRGNSEPVKFDLRAADVGPRPVSVTAWLDGAYLGELRAEIAVDRDGREGPARETVSEVTTEPISGSVSLVVRYDASQNLYRFEFRDIDYPGEVTSQLAYQPGPAVEQLVGELDKLAKGRSGYSEAETREYLVNAGVDLWQKLIPERLREQFWDRQRRIRQLTILTDNDVVPWELLYPKDKGHDEGFLVEQFPVTRSVFGRPPATRLHLEPARFVLPEPSPAAARDEVQELSRVLGCGPGADTVVSAITPLQELLRQGDFGLLHFACHNTFDPAGGSSIKFGDARFTPTFLASAAVDKTLARRETLVFVNACRSGGFAPSYNHLDGWAAKFLDAGAAAFIGSLWAVVDDTAREFAGEIYGHLRSGRTLGEAVTEARKAAASKPGDPTWLAYSVYGDPRATVTGGNT